MLIKPTRREAYRLLHDGALALARAERQGIRVDMEYCQSKHDHLTRKIALLEKRFFETSFYRHWYNSFGGRVNINSNDQLATFLYDKKKIKPTTLTESGKGSTDEDALLQLDIPELVDLLQIRKLKKVRDTYLGAFMREQVDGFIHPFYNLHLVKTFRSSSDSPNFQNIPKRDKEAMLLTRRALFPRVGHQLMEVDFKGIEVRIAACYHKDPTMLRYIKDPTTDMHGDMAVQLFGLSNFTKSNPAHSTLRSAAKNSFVFPQFYGDYYKNSAINLAIVWGKLPDHGNWRKGQGLPLEDGFALGDLMLSNGFKNLDDYIEHVRVIEDDFWTKRFPIYSKWKEQWIAEYKKKGYFDMFTGFRCSGVLRPNNIINYPVQGVAFHCLLWALIRLDYLFSLQNLQSKIIGQIHDAIVFDIYPPELVRVSKLIKQVMTQELVEHWRWIIVPMDVEVDLGEIDASWADLSFYKI